MHACMIWFNSLQYYYTVPPPVSVYLISDKFNPVHPIASEVTLSCIVELPPAVKSELSLLMVDTELSRGETQLPLTDPILTCGSLNYTAQLNSFRRNNSGTYICTATVRPGPNLTQLAPSTPITNWTRISTG